MLFLLRPSGSVRDQIVQLNQDRTRARPEPTSGSVHDADLGEQQILKRPSQY
jgi:hypothetical protein